MAQACATVGREVDSVALLAVSKRKPASQIRAAFAAGQTAFGENYLQEALLKQQELEDLPLQWHYIGPLQSNKCKSIAQHFDWAHSIERKSVALKLSQARAPQATPLQVCLQVNIDAEASKSGCAPDDLAELAQTVAQLPGLKLRGLMCIPSPDGDPHSAFGRLRELLHSLPQTYKLDTLSMGMSNDLESAVAQGSTLVRIGTAIFGARDN